MQLAIQLVPSTGPPSGVVAVWGSRRTSRRQSLWPRKGPISSRIAATRDGPHRAPESVFTFRVGPAFAFLTPGDTPATEATMRTTLVATICVITACAGSRSDSDRANNTADTAGAQIAAGEVAPSSHNTATALSDATVLGQLAEANQAEIAVGQMALQRTKSSEVRSFARRMVSDHTKMLNAGKAVADSLAVTPSPPSPDSLPQKTDQETQTLSALTGTAFDKAYMDAQVADHRMVLGLLGKLAAAAQDPRVQSLIAGAQPTVQQHLDRAQSLDAKVNTTM